MTPETAREILWRNLKAFPTHDTVTVPKRALGVLLKEQKRLERQSQRTRPACGADHQWVDCTEPQSTLCDPSVCHWRGPNGERCDLPPVAHPKPR